MNCFSFKSIIDYEFVSTVLEILDQYELFFRKHNKEKFDEAQHQALMHCIRLYKGDKKDVQRIKNYILSLGETILKKKEDNHPTLEYYDSVLEAENIIDDVLEKVYKDNMLDKHIKGIVEIALVFPDDFVKFCKAIIAGGEKSKFSPNFKEVVLSETKSNKDFTRQCLVIYEKYSNVLLDYINLTQESIEGWSEADFPYISRATSKRVQLVTEDGKNTMLYKNKLSIPKAVVDVDNTEAIKLKGTITDDVAVYKVNYIDALDVLEYQMFSEDTLNSIKCEIEGVVILRTPAGSVSTINPSFGSEIKLCKYEILTNILQAMSGKLIAEGTSNFYILAPRREHQLPHIQIDENEIEFKAFEMLF